MIALCIATRTSAIAGTTGGVAGRVVDATTNTPLAAAAVRLESPSQTAVTTSDAAGAFRVAALVPDTYSVTVERKGYETLRVPGINVFADQVATIKLQLLAKSLQVIARVKSARGLVEPGVTSNVASLNVSAIDATAALSGPGSVTQLYGSMTSVPGIFSPQGQSGWYQTLYIRGGDQDQVGYEYDGIPVARRDWQNAPVINFSRLGVQELQIYTGGIPATSDATGISGYVNVVAKSGTAPGFLTLQAETGAPAFEHSLQFEAGGTTQNFSYYLGLLGANQSYRYVDQNNGAGLSGTSFFFPVQLQNAMGCPAGHGCTYVSSGQQTWNTTPGFVSAPGNVYAIANTWDRENVINLHFALPHKFGPFKDDIQLLWMESLLANDFYSSLNDYNGPWQNVNGGHGLIWQDGVYYGGPVFAPPQAGQTRNYFFPSSPAHPFQGLLPGNQPDTWSLQAAIVKAQFLHAISAQSYFRIFAYTTYSDWLLDAPASLNFFYGLEAADWEPNTHTFGLHADYANQLGRFNYLTASLSYERTPTVGWSSFGLFGQPSTPISNLIDKNWNCYNPTTGALDSCYDAPARGTIADPAPTIAAPPGSPAAINRAHWVITETGQNYLTWTATPRFTSAAFSDKYAPNDRLTVDLGLRLERFEYTFGNTAAGYPARAFWFATFNREHCFGPNLIEPVLRSPGTPCPAGTSPTDIQNVEPSSQATTVSEPRSGFAYVLSRDDVLRGSYGVYARPPPTSWLQFGGQMQDLASFIGNGFSYYGFNTPVHALSPDESYNLDLTWEHQFHGSNIGFRLTPYLRSTANQQQIFAYDAVLGLTAGLNVGHQVSSGVEFLMSQGSFERSGLSWRLAYTYDTSRIRYSNFPSGHNVIDSINYYVEQYNRFTHACAKPNPSVCGAANAGSDALPSFPNGVVNPYYDSAPAPLFDRNGEYTTYDIFPAPFAGDNGYEVPNFATFTLNYRVARLTVTPSLSYSSGSFYGNPLTWPGYDPSSCTPLPGYGPKHPGPPQLPSCASAIFIPRAGDSFDTIGEFRQPWRLSGNLDLGYDANPRVKVSLSLLHVFDTCGQRGYPWDRSFVCRYSQLPSNVLPPVGNFATPANPGPAQLRYPYAAWNSNLNTDYLGVTIPFEAVFKVSVRL